MKFTPKKKEPNATPPKGFCRNCIAVEWADSFGYEYVDKKECVCSCHRSGLRIKRYIN